MKVIQGIRHLTHPLRYSVVTIGNFDGVHRGHQELISRAVSMAREKKWTSVVMTFEPHPIQVLYPERPFKRIFPREDQIQVLTRLGVDLLVLQPFSRELSQTPSAVFLKEYVVDPLKPKKIIVGYDFSFGAHREGTVKDLEEFSMQFSFELEIVPPFQVDGVAVSSTSIREAIEKGDVAKARRYLGRSFYLSGIVERGYNRGEQIGFRTANLFTKADCIPMRGVYATISHVEDRSWPSLTNVGTNPTFQKPGDPSEIHIETHILGLDHEIYGEELRVEFFEYLRPEKKFANVQELREQIQKDIELGKKVLHGHIPVG